MNAIYVSDDYFVQNVTYWSADGVTNSDIDVPSVSQLEAGQNITLELIDNAFNTITFVNVTNIKGETRIHAPKVKGGSLYRSRFPQGRQLLHRNQQI